MHIAQSVLILFSFFLHLAMLVVFYALTFVLSKLTFLSATGCHELRYLQHYGSMGHQINPWYPLDELNPNTKCAWEIVLFGNREVFIYFPSLEVK